MAFSTLYFIPIFFFLHLTSFSQSFSGTNYDLYNDIEYDILSVKYSSNHHYDPYDMSKGDFQKKIICRRLEKVVYNKEINSENYSKNYYDSYYILNSDSSKLESNTVIPLGLLIKNNYKEWKLVQRNPSYGRMDTFLFFFRYNANHKIENIITKQKNITKIPFRKNANEFIYKEMPADTLDTYNFFYNLNQLPVKLTYTHKYYHSDTSGTISSKILRYHIQYSHDYLSRLTEKQLFEVGEGDALKLIYLRKYRYDDANFLSSIHEKQFGNEGNEASDSYVNEYELKLFYDKKMRPLKETYECKSQTIYYEFGKEPDTLKSERESYSTILYRWNKDGTLTVTEKQKTKHPLLFVYTDLSLPFSDVDKSVYYFKNNLLIREKYTGKSFGGKTFREGKYSYESTGKLIHEDIYNKDIYGVPLMRKKESKHLLSFYNYQD